MNKIHIEEIIVVEGRDDISAVKRAVDAEIIEVNGFAVKKKKTLDKIKFAAEQKGVIVLTDPDFAGEQIRKTIENYVPEVKHAYISRSEGTKKDNVGVENAAPESIIAALKAAKFKLAVKREEFSMSDLIEYGLAGGIESKQRRQEVGTDLRIGYSNAKQFLSRLNNFNITREQFLNIVKNY